MDNIEPEIKTIPSKKLVGKQISMSLAENKTFELFRSFMPRRKEIINVLGSDVFCMQVYDLSLNFENFTPATIFNKWAAIEVTSFDNIPDEMETYTLTGGLYAVFLYKGAAKDFQSMFHYVFSTWIPGSKYMVDNREHFELLGERYKNNDPQSEEEIWVPVKLKDYKS